MNGATVESANRTNRPTMSRTEIMGASHHFLVSMMNDMISFRNCIAYVL